MESPSPTPILQAPPRPRELLGPVALEIGKGTRTSSKICSVPWCVTGRGRGPGDAQSLVLPPFWLPGSGRALKMKPLPNEGSGGSDGSHCSDALPGRAFTGSGPRSAGTTLPSCSPQPCPGWLRGCSPLLLISQGESRYHVRRAE